MLHLKFQSDKMKRIVAVTIVVIVSLVASAIIGGIMVAEAIQSCQNNIDGIREYSDSELAKFCKNLGVTKDYSHTSRS